MLAKAAKRTIYTQVYPQELARNVRRARARARNEDERERAKAGVETVYEVGEK